MCSEQNRQLVLALDTSTDMLACALAELADSPEEGAVSQVRVLAAADRLCRRHANEELTLSALTCLSEAGYTMDDIDAIVVGRGPGSFTGVRIGIATAKGLACGLEVPLYAASTLDAVAWGCWQAGVRGKLAVVDDAMRKEVYPGIYLLSDAGAERCFESETVCKAADCVAELAARPDAAELTLAGDALGKYRALFEEAGFTHFAPEELWHPKGESLLSAWTHASAQHATGDPALVLPVYTRLSDAEETERERLGTGKPGFVNPNGVAEELAGIHLQLRPMSLNDLEAIAAIEEDVFAGTPYDVWTRNMFYEELTQPGSTWWVAHDQGEIVGFAGGQLAGDTLDIMDVVVLPGRRREGIATRLLARVTYDGQMLGASSSVLEVYAGNEPAIATYRTLGYTDAGLRRDYYGPGNDALIMRASLPLDLPEDAHNTDPEPRPATRPWPPAEQQRSPEFVETLAATTLILAIESSCDETAVAVIDGTGEVLSSVVATQIDFHARFGGVVPEIASRKHTEAIVGVYEEAMAQAGEKLGGPALTASDLTAVAVTQGPGLVGALVVGIAFAKGLAAACDLPLIGVNHLEGHLAANLFETPDLTPPFVASLVSGGNTMLVLVRDWGDYEILGETIDDAVGEAFDKVAKALGLGYPGGPVISKLAAQGNAKAIRFPRAMLHSGDYRFSLSGLKTAVITYIEGENRAGRPIDLPDLAASFQAAVVDVQVAKALTAVKETGVSDICVGGGVAANPALRAAYAETFGKRGVRVTVPPLSVCGDNAAMIALVALRLFAAGMTSDLHMDADPNLQLSRGGSDRA